MKSEAEIRRYLADLNSRLEEFQTPSSSADRLIRKNLMCTRATLEWVLRDEKEQPVSQIEGFM